MFCKGRSLAKKRYERDVLVTMAIYAIVLFAASYMVRHRHIQGWALYVWSSLPAVPIIAVIARMGRYLQEETDEYQRLMTMRAILVGTAALLGSLVVEDFVRAFAGVQAFPPFASFLIFAAGMGMMQLFQRLQNRVTSDEE